MAPAEWTEVAMGAHRADIRRDDGLVIELQASAIGAEDVAKREAFYGEMVWLLDGREFVFDTERHGADTEPCCPVRVWTDTPKHIRLRPPCEKGRHVFERYKRVGVKSDRPEIGRWASGYFPVEHYLRYAPGASVQAEWSRRLRSFDFARAPIYIDLGPNGVFEIRRRGVRLIEGFYHSRQEFAAAAGLTWRADALGD